MQKRTLGSWIALTLLGCGGTVGGDPSPTPPMAPGALAAPTGLTVGALAGGAHVTWRDESNDEERFELERRDGDGAFRRLATMPFDITQYHDADVVPGVDYLYRVRAAAAGRASTFSSEVPFRIVEVARDGGVDADAGTTPPPDAGTGPEDSGTAPTISFRADIVPILTRSCGTGEMNCHSTDAYAGNPDRDCRGWLTLVDAPLGARNPVTGAPTGCPDRTLYQRLLELDAWMCNSPRRYIIPGDIAGSRVYELLAGDPTGGNDCFRAPNVPQTSMPPSSSRFTISASDLGKISAWIAAGAENN